MRRKRLSIWAILFFGVFTGLSLIDAHEAGQPIIAKTKYSDWDVPVITYDAVKHFQADNSGNSDASHAIQNAMNACFKAGGGTVYLPEGVYLIQNRIIIPNAVTLRGDWARPKEDDKSVRGTILHIVHDQNDPDAIGTILINDSAGIRDLSIFYPRQTSLPSVIRYPFAIEGVGSNSCVLNVTLVNAYQGIRYTRQPTGSVVFPYIRNVYGSPIFTGIRIHNTTATPRVENVHFSPAYWVESKLDQSITYDLVKKSIYSVKGVGISIGDGDGGGVFGKISLTGYYIGLQTTHESSPRVFDLTIKDSNIGVDLEYTKEHGWIFTSGVVEAESIAVLLHNHAKRAQFNNFVFSSQNRLIVHNSGVASFVNCRFLDWKGYAISSTGNGGSSGSSKDSLIGGDEVDRERIDYYLTVAGSSFSPGNHINIGAKISKAIIYGNVPTGSEFKVNNNSNSRQVVIRKEDVVDFQKVSISKYEFAERKTIKRPPSGYEYIFNIKNNAVANAVGDGVTDDTLAFEKVLRKAGEVASNRNEYAGSNPNGYGCVVYLPAGVYKILGHITIPSNVLLRGVHDVSFVTETARTILLSYADKDNASGQPFITMEKNSGIQGVYLFRPDQSFKGSLSKIYKYPVAIKGLGNNWAYNVVLGNIYDGIDFSNGGGHHIDSLYACSINKIVQIAADGAVSYIENLQYKTMAWTRAVRISLNEWKNNGFANGVPNEEQSHPIDNIGTGVIYKGNGEFVNFGHFVNRSEQLYVINGSPRAKFIICGGEGPAKGYDVNAADPGAMDLEIINNSYHTKKIYGEFSTSGGDRIRIFNSKHYGNDGESYFVRGGGVLYVQQEYRAEPPGKGYLTLSESSKAKIEGSYLQGPFDCFAFIKDASSKVMILGCMSEDRFKFRGHLKNAITIACCPRQ